MINIKEETRHCEVYKAKNNMWYFELEEPVKLKSNSNSRSILTFGPFASLGAAKRYLKDNFMDTGGVYVDDRGSEDPPKKIKTKSSKLKYVVNDPYFISAKPTVWN